MNTLAALMVLVACHPQQTSCLEEPVAVISYASGAECRAALPSEMDRARRMAKLIYGDCVPVNAELLAGRQIHRTIDPVKLSALTATSRATVAVKAFSATTMKPGAGPFDSYEEAK